MEAQDKQHQQTPKTGMAKTRWMRKKPRPSKAIGLRFGRMEGSSDGRREGRGGEKDETESSLIGKALFATFYLPKMNGWLGRDILGFETYRGNS